MIASWVGLALGIVFLVIVAPLWIVAHYLTRWRASRKLSAEDEKAMGELWQTARRMEARIDALERLLDAEAPGWRGTPGG
jgi:phage shock protein B